VSAARILELAFEADAQSAVEDRAGERILDAALELAAASGLRHLTMDAVAARARVGRMTVYRRFGSRQQLVDALAVRECRRCLARIAAVIDPAAPPPDRAAALLLGTLAVIREHPLLERLARVEPDALLRELTRDDSAVFKLVREFLVGLVTPAQAAGELVDADPQILAELAIRLGASFVLLPDTAIPLDDERRVREIAATLLVGAAPQR
jgi:AcrR family transcriptional regulator